MYDYIKANRLRSPSVEPASSLNLSLPMSQPGPSSSVDTARSSSLVPESNPTSNSEDKSDTFKLQVRCHDTTIRLTVRPSTLCSSIVTAALKKMEKDDPKKKGRIEVDGERMAPDTAIRECDLEDDDLVDIVGV